MEARINCDRLDRGAAARAGNTALQDAGAAKAEKSIDQHLAAAVEALVEGLELRVGVKRRPEPRDEITFESFTVLGALAHATRRVRIGHMVICNGFRNPALTAKMGSTLDVISGGRFELGIGAGWKEDEWRAYGYGFPTLKERLEALGDGLEVITRMLGEGRATYHGRWATVKGAINVPKGVQPRIPVIVGGNGENVTFRYAAKHATELNLVFLDRARVAEALPVIRSRCEEIGRDPAEIERRTQVRRTRWAAERSQASSSSSRPGSRALPAAMLSAIVASERSIASSRGDSRRATGKANSPTGFRRIIASKWRVRTVAGKRWLARRIAVPTSPATRRRRGRRSPATPRSSCAGGRSSSCRRSSGGSRPRSRSATCSAKSHSRPVATC